MVENRRRISLLVAGGLLAAAALIPAATTGQVAVAPSPVWLWLTAVGLALLVAIPERMWKHEVAWAVGVGLVVGLAAGHVLLRSGFPYTQDGGTHLWALHTIYRSFDGHWTPGRWVSEIGLGIPLLLHHGPLPYLPGIVSMALGATVYDAFKVTLLLSLIGSGAAMYWSAREVTGRRDTAIVAAVAYVFAPYHLLDTHYRGALGESVALIAVPVFLEAAVALITGRDRNARTRLVLATVWLALSHPMTLFTAGVGAGVAALVWWMLDRHRLSWRWLLPVGLGTALAGYWIVPGVLEVGHTSFPLLDNSRPPRFGEHGLALVDLVWRRLWYGRLPSYPASQVAPGTALEMPFYFGLTLVSGLVTALVGTTVGRDRDRDRLELLTWSVVGMVAVAMTLLPVARVLAAWPLFPKLQFAWRFLAIGSAAAAMALAGVLARVHAPREDRSHPGVGVALSVLCLGLLVWDAAPYTGASDWVPAYHGTVHWYDAGPAGEPGLFRDRYRPAPVSVPRGTLLRVSGLEFPPARPTTGIQLVRGQYSEYLTPTLYRWLARPTNVVDASRNAGVSLAFTPRSPDPVVIPDPAPWAQLETGGHRVAWPELTRQGRGARFQVTLPDGHPGGTLHLLEQAGPGWEVAIDDGPWQAVAADGLGLMAVPVAEGVRELRFRFGLTTWQRILGLLVTMVGLGVVATRGRVRVEERIRRLLARVANRPVGRTIANRWAACSESTRDRWSLTLIASVAVGFRLGTGSLTNGTDAIYGIAIRNLVEHGDWWSPAVHGTPYVMKPPLFFWSGALFARVLGVTELALRLPAAVGVVLATVATYQLGRTLAGRRLGWFAALLLLTCVPFYEFSRRVFMDPLLAGLTAAAAVAWWQGLHRDRRWYWAAGVLTGLAVLTKSYAGLFSASAFFGYLVLLRRDALRDWRPWTALALALAIPLPWVLVELSVNQAVFVEQTLAVFRLRNEAQFSWHPYRDYFYALEMFDQDRIFTLLTVFGLGIAVPAFWKGNRAWLFPALWLLGPLTLYWNLSQQRLYYLLPLLPAAALFGALFLDRALPHNWPTSRTAVPFLLLFLVHAAPSVAPTGSVLDPTPGLRSVALAADQLAPPDAEVLVWNDFFAAPELYSGRMARQITPSSSLASEIQRILVVGTLGIVTHVRPPDGLWDLYQSARAEGRPWVLLIQDRELRRLSPGLPGGCVAAQSESWRLVMTAEPGSRSCTDLADIPAEEDAYLAAAKYFSRQEKWEDAARTMEALARHHRADAGRAWRIAAGFYDRAGKPELAERARRRAAGAAPRP